MSANPSSHGNTGDLEASLQSLHKIISSVTHAQLRIHPAPDERLLLDNIEGQLTTLFDESRASLRYRRNQLAPINNLPDEVLLIILLHAKSDSAPWEMLEYLPVTRICRRWRVLAIESPVLWNLVDLAYPKDDVLDEILRRSKSTKLSVGQLGRRLRPSHSWRPSQMGWIDNEYIPASEVDKQFWFFKKCIVPILQRVEALELKLPTTHWIDVFTLFRDTDLSISRCHFHEICDAAASQAEEPVFRQSATFFLSKIINPHTQVLDIRFQRLPLDPISKFPQANRLRALALTRGGPQSATNSLTLQGLLPLLESCRFELQSLKLFVLPQPTPTPLLLPQRRISMPRLRSMVLDSPADTIVLECLSTPVLRTLCIDAQNSISQLSTISHCMDFTTVPHMTVERDHISGYREAPIGVVPDATLRIKNYEVNRFSIGSIGTNLTAWADHILSLTMDETIVNYDLPELILKQAHVLRSVSIDDGLEDILSLLMDVTTCPELECLTYRCKSRCWPPGKGLVSLVRSRRNGGVALKKLILFARQQLAKTNLEKLEKWLEYCYIDTSDC